MADSDEFAGPVIPRRVLEHIAAHASRTAGAAISVWFARRTVSPIPRAVVEPHPRLGRHSWRQLSVSRAELRGVVDWLRVSGGPRHDREWAAPATPPEAGPSLHPGPRDS